MLEKKNCLEKNMHTLLIVTIHSGSRKNYLRDFTLALQSHQHALDVKRKLFREEHANTADSYHSLGITQHEHADYTSALRSKQHGLDVRRNCLEKNVETPLIVTIH